MHESLSGLGESEGTFDDSATAKMMQEKDEKGIIGEPVSQSFETPRKRLLHRLLLTKRVTVLHNTWANKTDQKNSDPQLPQGLMCTNDENTITQLLVPWQESLVGFSNVSS